MTKGLAKAGILGLLVFNGVLAYVGVIFAMLSGAEAAYFVGGIFVATNAIGLGLSIFFLGREAYARAVLAEAVVSPAAFVFVAALGSALISSGVFAKQRHWDEQVLTTSGKQLVVKRSLKWTPLGPGSHHGISAELSGAGVVTWDTTLAPWMLDQAQDGRWYLVGRVDSFKAKQEYGLFDDEEGRTKDFVSYRLTARRWERIIAADFPGEFHGPNLIVYPRVLFEEVKHQRLYFDGTKLRPLPDGLPIADGAVVNMEFKSRVNFPFNREHAYIFQPSAKHFDDGRRLICKRDGTPCIRLENGLDERFGKGPVQQVGAK